MKYQILCVGKIKDSFYRDEIESLCDAIKRRTDGIEILEFPDQKIPENLREKNIEIFLEKECSKMYDKISAKDYVIALCIEGKEITTVQHRDYIKKAEENGYERITYIIGGSLGLPLMIKKRAGFKMSFSKMTLPHQMMRMILCEEILNMINR
ncbi:MAG: 23S rRNA (pseudouridine(1915)-N(3))-methyltransferase RlmH [Lachnospiraceae bacterium]|nr:23S rRNA (pseudouridine(1915)-N(3))-methyltransferase RlmH [Lachnospiraceae bacterium]